MAAPMTKEDKQILLLAIILGVGISLAFWFMIYQPSLKKYSGLDVKRKSLQAEVDKLSTYVEGPDSQAKIIELKNQVAAFEQKLPSEKEVPSLLNFMRDAADAAEVQYLSIISQAPVPSNYYVEIPFSVTLKGKYHNIGQVINKIENHKRFMKVSKVDMLVGKDVPYKHTCTLRMSTYVFNGNEPTTSKSTTGK